MEVRIHENIRALRKERSLTQEHLAEVLGVTVGAVHKWEAGLSIPEIRMIMKIADFFDVSVDVLLGYEVRYNRISEILERLRSAKRSHDKNILKDAEKALKKYPHSFDIVYQSALLNFVFGIESKDKELLLHSIELFKMSKLYISQNTDPKISEVTVSGYMAEAMLALNENREAVELLKANNPKGLYNDIIGMTLASTLKDKEAAIPFLSESLVQSIVGLLRTVIGFLNIYLNDNDHVSACAILRWAIPVLLGLRRSDEPSFLDKTVCFFYACLAYSELSLGERDNAKKDLSDCIYLAEKFDRVPNYGTDSIRFATSLEDSAFDDLGQSAIEGISNIVASFEDDDLKILWEEIYESRK